MSVSNTPGEKDTLQEQNAQLNLIGEESHKALSFLYRLYEVTDGNTDAHPKITELGREVGLSHEDSYEVVSRLQAEGLVETVAKGLRVRLTTKGAGAVDASSVDKEAPERLLPVPSNVINIYGDVTNSPIQQATRHSVQGLTEAHVPDAQPSHQHTNPQRKERLFANLLPVTSYPPRIFMADTFYRFRGDLFREMQRLTPKPNGIWTLKGGRIITFCDLHEYPWQHLCDQGTVESFGAEEWAQAEDPNERRLFSELLRLTLQDALYKKYVGFDREKRVYYFRVNGKNITRKLYYHSQQKRASREIIRAYPNTKEPRYYRHYAFKGMFRYIERHWHLEISPTHYYTSDGFHRYPFDESLLSGLKRLEGNRAVLGQLIMWSRLLTEQDDMFGVEEPFLRFGELPVFMLEGGFDDSSWGKQEAPNTSALLDLSQEAMELVSE